MTDRKRPCLDDCNRSTCTPTKCDGRIPWAELPCREFCNAYRHGCDKERCANPYDRDDPRHWLGRGSEPVAGKPFGWSHVMQRRAIYDHMKARGRDPKAIDEFFQASRIEMRLERDYHRRKPKIGIRKKAGNETVREDNEFNEEELTYMVDMFGPSNNPVAQSIAEKAKRKLAK